MDAYLQALKAYQTFNPAGWVAIYRLLPMWAGIICGAVGLVYVLFGGTKYLFRLVALPLGAVLGLAWTPVVIEKLVLLGMDPRLPTWVAAGLGVLGLLFPPAVLFFAVGLPVGLLAGELVGTADFLLGFGPGLLVGGMFGAILHRPVSALLGSATGAWLMVLGLLAALHQFGGLVSTVAAQPWGLIAAAGLFALAGFVYQVFVRPTPEALEKQRAEKQRLALRKAEQKAMEKRWSSSQRSRS